MNGLVEHRGEITREELQKATRNRGMPLEALALDVTPVGLHYLLVHFDIPMIDPTSWYLTVAGNVETKLDLALDDLRSMPAVSERVTLECAGNGRALMEPRPISQPWGLEAVSTAEWTGVPLAHVLDLAGPYENTVDVVFSGVDRGSQSGVEDHYRRALPVYEAMRDGMLLAYEMNGRPLEPQNGAPLRLVAPGWYGMAHVKWLSRIEVATQQFTGVQHDDYRFQQSPDDPGTPVTTMRVRSLMVPPGIPDSFARHRLVDAGDIAVRGRAWSGIAPIARVEFAVDDVWRPADLDSEAVGRFAWIGWSTTWSAEPGDHVLACRAIDAAGNEQPMDAPWNVMGMGNNAVQRVPVTVR